MGRLFNNKGLTLVEVIMTLTILGAVICPLMNFMVLAEKINKEGEVEYGSIQTSQYYMEEIKAMNGIDTERFVFNSEKMCYERIISAPDNCKVEIRIIVGSYGLHYIEIDIIREEEIISSLVGSVVF